jgi:2-hydroxychromene-2-carboxylate isomerase
MSKQLEFFFDFGSPTAYLAWTQLPGLCRDAGAQLVYRPMLLGGVFKSTGNQSPAMIPAKGRYMHQDMQRFARRYGVTLNQNPHFPINTLYLMRGAAGMQMRQPERLEAYITAIYQAMWVDAKNTGDLAVLAEVLGSAGFDPQQLLALIEDEAVKQQLKSTTEEAIRRGTFGAPTMYVGDEQFFGQDRLDFVREALQA